MTVMERERDDGGRKREQLDGGTDMPVQDEGTTRFGGGLIPPVGGDFKQDAGATASERGYAQGPGVAPRLGASPRPALKAVQDELRNAIAPDKKYIAEIIHRSPDDSADIYALLRRYEQDNESLKGLEADVRNYVSKLANKPKVGPGGVDLHTLAPTIGWPMPATGTKTKDDYDAELAQRELERQAAAKGDKPHDPTSKELEKVMKPGGTPDSQQEQAAKLKADQTVGNASRGSSSGATTDGGATGSTDGGEVERTDIPGVRKRYPE
jgi:hypothetical protein